MSDINYTNLSDMKLKNKVTVVTGGNSGIGLGIAKAFKNEGATGVITGRNQRNLELSLEQLGGDFIGLTGDVTNQDDLEKIFKLTFEKFGKIDALVVNAGGPADGAEMGAVSDIGEDSYDRYMDLNLKSVYFTVQKALPYIKDGASIILIGSAAGHRASPGVSVYSAAKAGVISFAKGFSLDLLARKIRVNVISPGPIDTPVFNKLVPEEHLEHVKQLWLNLVPAGRLGRPEDIGNAAAFLASDESSFLLGAEILSDGGMTNIGLMN